ncbi:hypothetical protein [Phenylobacterium sp.]|uniref:hypothetical protein n=1 Tax=Phenylobacterium sp. TaxID=1871053 RepID=UPI0035B39752
MTVIIKSPCSPGWDGPLTGPDEPCLPPMLRAALRADDDRRTAALLALQLGQRLAGSADPLDHQLLAALGRWAEGELV